MQISSGASPMISASVLQAQRACVSSPIRSNARFRQWMLHAAVDTSVDTGVPHNLIFQPTHTGIEKGDSMSGDMSNNLMLVMIHLPAVIPHKAVAEVSKIGSL